MKNKQRFMLIIQAILIVVPGALTGCSAGSTSQVDHAYSLAHLDAMPKEVQDSPVIVQQAYQFAAANPDVLQELPCYCGCGSMGHTSNYSCYFSNTGPVETLTFDAHALGCNICVDITQDAMRMLDQGKSMDEIRTEIDTIYSKYGPSNISE